MPHARESRDHGGVVAAVASLGEEERDTLGVAQSLKALAEAGVERDSATDGEEAHVVGQRLFAACDEGVDDGFLVVCRE